MFLFFLTWTELQKQPPSSSTSIHISQNRELPHCEPSAVWTEYQRNISARSLTHLHDHMPLTFCLLLRHSPLHPPDWYRVLLGWPGCTSAWRGELLAGPRTVSLRMLPRRRFLLHWWVPLGTCGSHCRQKKFREYSFINQIKNVPKLKSCFPKRQTTKKV